MHALCKEIEEEMANRNEVGGGDLAAVLEKLTIVEKRPSARLLKQREIENTQKARVERYHTHRNPKYDEKCREQAIVPVCSSLLLVDQSNDASFS